VTAALAASLALLVAPLAGQVPVAIAGHTVRVQARDTLPQTGVTVTLHRISRTAQGAIDSTVVGADGAFRFRLRGDSGAIYLVSARYAGIEYFGEPIRPPGAEGIRIVLSDTSSTAPVRLGGRHVIIRPPGPTGTRAVLDLLSLRNDGPDTRVGRDSLSAAWTMVLPAGATKLEVSEGDVSPSAVEFRGDTMLVLAPIAPGGKNLMVSYELPIGVGRPAWSAPADSFDLLVEEPGAAVRGAGLTEVAPVELMGSTLRRWTAVSPPGGEGVVTFAGGPRASNLSLYLLVGTVALVLMAGAGLVLRRSGRPPPVRVAAAPPADLIGRVAALDARYLGRADKVPPEEWADYERERARLMTAALARSRPRP